MTNCFAYGLRESPLLWQKHLTGTLRNQGFTPVPHEPCCFTMGGVIVFFYIDDLVVAFPKECGRMAQEAIATLKHHYSLQGGGNLQWFLGVSVLRDRQRHLIWLSQSTYPRWSAFLIQNSRTAIEQRLWASAPSRKHGAGHDSRKHWFQSSVRLPKCKTHTRSDDTTVDVHHSRSSRFRFPPAARPPEP